MKGPNQNKGGGAPDGGWQLWAQNPLPVRRYVFIVTYGRSGSTLLQNLLNAIPGFEIRGENNNALLHIARAWEALDSSQTLARLREAGEPTDQTHPWFGGELIHPPHVARAMVRGFVNTVLKPSDDTRVSGFKEIRFHAAGEEFEMYLDFIYRFFPNVKFIFNTRDKDAVAQSGWWKGYAPETVHRILGEAEGLYHAYMEKNPERGFHLHYDDYVGRPAKLRPLFEFLGEPFDRDMVEQVLGTKLDHLKKRSKSSN
ncbi:sulfotransferase family protein [Mesobacterium pallidum]|uniref:sulfotransferase family protein n=1 Tax=Mesobacterium pallidum TaxID=2872037 RepID=UPI001EE30D47|nr:sulfotransferase [Mesobacterium pallidum]